MAKKRESINPFGNNLNDGIIRVSILSFETDRNYLFNMILNHINSASCKDCQWTLVVLDKKDYKQSQHSNKNCLLIIEIEFALIGRALLKLSEDFGVKIISQYDPLIPVMIATILIYCE